MTYSNATTQYNQQIPKFGYAPADVAAANPYSNFLVRKHIFNETGNSLFTKKNTIATKNKSIPAEILNPKGRLVKGSLFSCPTFVPTTTVIKDFGRALKGEGTDHSLGGLNDPAIGLGSLAIAGVLAATAKGKFNKAMEFVGAGTWLGSMVLWPKLFLAAPVKALTGVDMNLEYVNAQGEQKPFHRDAQYKPWDLVTDKMYNEMGKKLKVPANQPDRKEEIQRRADKVATGVNTWWMLSAGASTPLMASVFANKLEYPVKRALDGAKMVSVQARLHAAGYDTGSKNPLVAVVKAIVKPFHDRKLRKEEANVETLHNLVAIKDYDGISKFYSKNLPDDKEGLARNYVFPHVKEAIETLKKNDADEECTNFLKNAYGEASRFNREYPIAKDLEKVALNDSYGTLRERSLPKMLKHLGIEGNDYKQMALHAEHDNIPENAHILDKCIKKAAQNDDNLKELNKISDKVVTKVDGWAQMVTDVAHSMSEKYDVLAKGVKQNFVNYINHEGKPAVGEMLENAENLRTKARVTFDFEPSFEQAKAGAKDLHMQLRGLGNNFMWNGLKNAAKNVKRAFLEKEFGKKQHGKKVTEELIIFTDPATSMETKNAMKKTMEQIIGESKAQMIGSTIKNKGFWSNRVMLFGILPLAVSTAAAIWLIARNGKKDNSEGRTK